MVGSVLILLSLLFNVEAAVAQTYTQMQWGMNKGVTPYQFGANINGVWSNLGTVSASGVWNIPVSSIPGLGTAATRNIGTSGATVPLLNTVNTWSGAQSFDAGATIPFSQGAGGAITSTVDAKLKVTEVNIVDFGAKCDGVTDDAAAINAALVYVSDSSRSTTVRMNGCTARVASTIFIPNGITFEGKAFTSGNASTLNSRILCDATVSPCIQGGSNNGQVSIRRLYVQRAGGTPAANLIGIRIQNAYNVTLEDVMVKNHGVGYYFLATPASGLGLGAMMTRVYSGAISDAHIVVDGWPELRISQSRFGMNGGGDYASNAYVRFTGGTAGTSGGPNTFVAENSQFNSGSTPALHWLEFVNLGAGGVPSIDATTFKFYGNHIENFSASGAMIYSDASWNIIDRFYMADNTFNGTGTPCLDLNAGTKVSRWNLTSNIFQCSNFNLAPTSQFDLLSVLGGSILGPINITSPSAGSTASFTNMMNQSTATFSGSWGALGIFGHASTGGSLNISGVSGNYAVSTSQHFKVTANNPQFTQNLGIGKAPTQALDVNGSIQSNDNFLQYSTTIFRGYQGRNNTNVWGYFQCYSIGCDNGGLELKNSNVANVKILASGDSFLNGGNVAIGKTTSATRLDVAGTMRTGTYTIATLPVCGASILGAEVLISDGTAFGVGTYGSVVSATGIVTRKILCTNTAGATTYAWAYD
jgi:hypothetical protein